MMLERSSCFGIMQKCEKFSGKPSREHGSAVLFETVTSLR